MTIKIKQKLQRQQRVRVKLRNANALPRLTVFRSNKHIYAQLIDDAKHITLFGVSEKLITVKGTKVEVATILGKKIAELAKEKKIDQIKFDKGSYRYHGRIKALADGAREGGLTF
jgi:large subunit ribosomal protein L18